MKPLTRHRIPYDQPATYQICALGRVDPTWSDRLEGMTISLSTGEEGNPMATLRGELRDQAALAGVLNTLYELRLTILSVERANS